MERPAKRMRLLHEDTGAAQHEDSRKNLGGDSRAGTNFRSTTNDVLEDDLDRTALNAYTPQHMYHRHDFEQEVRRRRQRLSRRAAADQLTPRTPKKTTLNVVDVIIDEAENAVAALTLPERPAVVTVGTYGAVTVEPSVTQTPDSSSAVPGTELTPSSQSSLVSPSPAPSASTSPPATTPVSGTGASSSHSVATILETTISIVGQNHTSTITESSDTTTTSTSTSTLELSFVNGTIVTVHPSTSLSMSFSSNSTMTSSNTSTTSSSMLSSSPSTSIASTASAGAGSGGMSSPTSSSPSSPTSTSNSSGGRSGPSTPTVVGSIVGGIAGLALILLLLLFVIRRYRRRLKAQNALPPSSTDPSSGEPTARSGAMAEVSPRSSGHTPLAAAVTPGFLSKWRHSGQTTTSVATSDTGERGFQKLGGRKIASVLQSGGDQYGGNYGAFEKDGASTGPSGRGGPGAGNLSGASFYRDSAGFYGGDGSRPGTPLPSSVDVPGPSQARDFAENSEGIAVMRPSPARTPVTSAGGIPRPTGSNPSTPRERSREPGARTGPDALGRSLASFDGSRGSKFTEGV